MKFITGLSAFWVIVLCLSFFSPSVGAMLPSVGQSASDLPSFYKKQREILWPAPSTQSVPVTASFTVPFGTTRGGILILNTAGVAQPSVQRVIVPTVSATVSFQGVSTRVLNDQNTTTTLDIPVNDQFGTYYSRFRLELAQPTALYGIDFVFDSLSAIPEYIDIVADPNTTNERVVENRSMFDTGLRFPETTVSVLEITLQHTQPLRLAELQPISSSVVESTEEIRFLAQPNAQYTMYYDRAELAPPPPVVEVGNLFARPAEVILSAAAEQPNKQFVSGDSDLDGTTDEHDNCPSLSNPDQQDENQNGRGDACEDFDADQVLNSVDNCPENPNYDQVDADGDRVGDACDDLESRLTEQYPWLPWAALGFTAVMIAALFATALKSSTWKS